MKTITEMRKLSIWLFDQLDADEPRLPRDHEVIAWKPKIRRELERGLSFITAPTTHMAQDRLFIRHFFEGHLCGMCPPKMGLFLTTTLLG